MEKLRPNDGGKNNIADQLKALRNQYGLSQRDLADKLQLKGLNFDKNIITRIETSSRFVNDFELKALSNFFGVSYAYFLDRVPTSENLEEYPDFLEMEVLIKNHVAEFEKKHGTIELD